MPFLHMRSDETTMEKVFELIQKLYQNGKEIEILDEDFYLYRKKLIREVFKSIEERKIIPLKRYQSKTV
ncbi:MAG TPA: hypothetical protein DHW82_00350 [Spirochaetia bacterium]|nr:MAG: hypothetical protein A2Y41_01510 [Spirochaetes bacterium GWB1_36_13]HCL55451.1 hypothetical protein [Spirochaetia bacterium]